MNGFFGTSLDLDSRNTEASQVATVSAWVGKLDNVTFIDRRVDLEKTLVWLNDANDRETLFVKLPRILDQRDILSCRKALKKTHEASNQILMAPDVAP